MIILITVIDSYYYHMPMPLSLVSSDVQRKISRILFPVKRRDMHVKRHQFVLFPKLLLVLGHSVFTINNIAIVLDLVFRTWLFSSAGGRMQLMQHYVAFLLARRVFRITKLKSHLWAQGSTHTCSAHDHIHKLHQVYMFSILQQNRQNFDGYRKTRVPYRLGSSL